jgi:hypothetical protein
VIIIDSMTGAVALSTVALAVGNQDAVIFAEGVLEMTEEAV